MEGNLRGGGLRRGEKRRRRGRLQEFSGTRSNLKIGVAVIAGSHIIDYTGKGGFVPPVLEVSVLKSSHKLRSNPQIQQHRALFLGGYRVSLIGRFHRQLAASWAEYTAARP